MGHRPARIVRRKFHLVAIQQRGHREDFAHASHVFDVGHDHIVSASLKERTKAGHADGFLAPRELDAKCIGTSPDAPDGIHLCGRFR